MQTSISTQPNKQRLRSEAKNMLRFKSRSICIPSINHFIDLIVAEMDIKTILHFDLDKIDKLYKFSDEIDYYSII